MPSLDDDDLRASLTTVLAANACDGAGAHDVPAVSARIDGCDADSWVHEWTVAGGAAWASAHAAAAGERPAAARRQYLRAASYYAAALDAVQTSSEPERHLVLWRRQRECFDRAAGLFEPAAEHVAIPYEHTTLPAYLFRAPHSSGDARPLVVVDHGGDLPLSHALALGGAAAAERGYHWLTFDGPGQGAALHEQGLPSRPDWEAVLTPLVDELLRQPGVDARRIGLIGAGRGGYGAARALVFEHRFAAAVVDPGVCDLSAPVLQNLLPELRAPLYAGDAPAFARVMRFARLLAPEEFARLRSRVAAFGRRDAPDFELLRNLMAHRLGQEVASIRTPLLLLERTPERHWPGQARALDSMLTAPHRRVQLPSAGPAATLREQAVFGWLDSHLLP